MVLISNFDIYFELKLINMKKTGLYLGIWRTKIKQIFNILEAGVYPQSIKMSSDEFKRAGDRAKYSFNLEIINGERKKAKTKGHAMNRDLKEILYNSSEIKMILKKGHYKFNMGKAFILKINKLSD